MEEAERPELGRIAAVARGAIDGDAIKSRLDMPTLDHVFAVEEWRNGRKWADCGSSAFLHHEAETDIAEACIYRSLRSRVRIVSRSLSHGRYEPFSRLARLH